MDLEAQSVVAPRLKKRKVVTACDFCVRRKLGCDNAKPKCSKCLQHGKDCTYAERQHKERPSKLRIAQLEEENGRLRKIAAFAQSHGTSLDHSQRSTLQADKETNSIGPNVQEHCLPSTTNIQPSFRMSTTNTIPKLHVSGARESHLFDRTARQRQLEAIEDKTETFRSLDINPKLGEQLLSAFWNRQHASAPTVYRTAFMRDMANGGRYFTSLLLNAIFFVATKNLPSLVGQCSTADSCNRGLLFRGNVEAELFGGNRQFISSSDITTVQALLLMSDGLYSWCDEKSLSWHYLGIAINTILDLGLHTIRSKFYCSGSAEDHEVGRRVFWAAYVRDIQLSIYQGRPARLRYSNSNVPISFLDDYDELQAFDTFTYSESPRQTDIPTRSISCFEQLCRLSIIAESILDSMYSEKSYTKEAAALLRSSVSLQGELDQWHKMLPAHLRVQAGHSKDCDILPHTLSLMAFFHTLIILLHRPFVSDGHLQSIVRSNAAAAFKLCVEAANGIDAVLHVYQQRFCSKSCPYFLSYATYVSGTIHVRVAAQSPTGSEAHLALWNCLAILEEQQTLCHAPRQSMKILMGLVKRLAVDPGRHYRVEVSRSATSERHQGDNESSQPSGEVLTPNELTHSSSASMNLAFEPSDFDINAVMNSFELDPSISSTQTYPNDLSITDKNDNTESGLPVIVGQADTNFQDPLLMDFSTLFDPVVGIDALCADTIWSLTGAG